MVFRFVYFIWVWTGQQKFEFEIKKIIRKENRKRKEKENKKDIWKTHLGPNRLHSPLIRAPRLRVGPLTSHSALTLALPQSPLGGAQRVSVFFSLAFTSSMLSYPSAGSAAPNRAAQLGDPQPNAWQGRAHAPTPLIPVFLASVNKSPQIPRRASPPHAQWQPNSARSSRFISDLFS
jgi:hypothetical protein